MREVWNDLMKERFLKLGALKAGGRNPWPNDQAPGWTAAGARAAASVPPAEELASREIRVDIAGRIVASLVFSAGLCMVVIAGAELFTGNNLVAMAWASRRVTFGALLRNWGVVYLGNVIGASGLPRM